MSDRGTILVVDDEVGPRESLRFILKSRYEIITAGNGQEALRILHDRDIDLVTLDLNMPGLPGLNVLKEIRKMVPETEVIIITGYGNLSNAQESICYGAGNFISKPFNVAEIITIVSKCFERRLYNYRIKTIIQKIKALKTPTTNDVEDYFDSEHGKLVHGPGV
jgi:putative two-component system response regulator